MDDAAMAAALAANREAAENEKILAESNLDALIKNQLFATQTGHGEPRQFQLDQGDQQFVGAEQSILSQDEALLKALHLQTNAISSGLRDFSDDASMASSSNRSVHIATEAQTAAQMETALLKQILSQQHKQEREAEMQRQLDLARLALIAQQQQQQLKFRDEHFIRVSCKGSMILGATKTITGVNPNSLLMTSFYQDVHYDDLRGIRAIQKRYWMKGSPSVTCYLRRLTIDNDWVWVKSSVVSLVYQPVPEFVVREVRETDEESAYACARLIKIVSILMDSIEEAASFQEDCIYKKNANLDSAKNNVINNSFPTDMQNQNQKQKNLKVPELGNKVDPSFLEVIPGLKDDAVALEALIASVESSGDTSTLQALEKIIKTAVKGDNGFPHKNPTQNDTESNINDDKDKKISEEVSILKLCRKGPSLSLARMDLTPAEFKLIILVLVGKITLEKLGPLVMEVVESEEKDLAVALDGILLDIEVQQLKQQEKQKLARENMQSNVTKQGKKRGTSLQSFRDHVSRQENMSQSHNTHNYRFMSSGSQSNYYQMTQRREDTNYLRSNSATSLKSGRRNSGNSKTSSHSTDEKSSIISLSKPTVKTPWISVINLSNSLIGNFGMEMFAQVLQSHTPALKTLDLSFCRIDEKGILSLCRALKKRKALNLDGLQGLILSGNKITYRSAKELGIALSSSSKARSPRFRKRNTLGRKGGYEEEDEDSENGEDEDDDFENDFLFGNPQSQSQSKSPRTGKSNNMNQNSSGSKEGQNILGKKKIPSHSSGREQRKGLQLLHLGSTSLQKDCLLQILLGLGPDCQLRELAIPSNNIGTSGVTLICNYLEGKYNSKNKVKPGHLILPKLDRLDLSNNNLGNDGTAKLTRAISKRGKNVTMVDLHVSHNEIGSGGIETIMNKLLQQKLVVLSLDNNVIADRGCQLVAASLPSMHHLSRLNLSFNQIGSRGVTSLMRGLTGCESMTYLGLSGNVMKISGAIAMGFALAHHPRLAELELDNCCLSQVSQCHIVAGIISNRWVPMQTMNGFWAGPPMVAIGALDSVTQDLKNEDCFRIRRDIQMKTILKASAGNADDNAEKDIDGENQNQGSKDFLSVDFVRGSSGATSQSAYLRMLDWLSRIPFDEEELNYLQRYFYDADYRGDGMKSSEGNLDFLKHRGDLLAALGSGIVADEIRENNNVVEEEPEGFSVGLVLDSDDDMGQSSFSSLKSYEDGGFSIWKSIKSSDNSQKRKMSNNDCEEIEEEKGVTGKPAPNNLDGGGVGVAVDNQGKNSTIISSISSKKRRHSSESSDLASMNLDTRKEYTKGSVSSLSKQSLSRAESECSGRSTNSKGEPRSGNAVKARIGMFPQFAANLDLLKASAQEMMDNEVDSNQQDIIAQQFAEASLTLLRQLRYHCMNSGLDGWRQGKIVRKVLIVDDSKVTRKIVARAFEKANFIVDTAENGVEGVGKLKKSIYDIAFMDIDMPVMNGFDATKALRDWEDGNRPGARQPICALTAAYVDDFERSELMKFKEAGLDVMESKPCNIPRLFKVVDDVSPMFSDLSISVTQQLDSSFSQA